MFCILMNSKFKEQFKLFIDYICFPKNKVKSESNQ